MNYNEARKMFEEIKENTIEMAAKICIEDTLHNPHKIIFAKALAEKMNCTEMLLLRNFQYYRPFTYLGKPYCINPYTHEERITYVNPLDPADTISIIRRRTAFEVRNFSY